MPSLVAIQSPNRSIQRRRASAGGNAREELAGALGQPGHLVGVDRGDQGLPGREVPIKRGDAHPGLARDLAQRRLGVGRS